jgi:hypothetical protein
MSNLRCRPLGRDGKIAVLVYAIRPNIGALRVLFSEILSKRFEARGSAWRQLLQVVGLLDQRPGKV